MGSVLLQCMCAQPRIGVSWGPCTQACSKLQVWHGSCIPSLLWETCAAVSGVSPVGQSPKSGIAMESSRIAAGKRSWLLRRAL